MKIFDSKFEPPTARELLAGLLSSKANAQSVNDSSTAERSTSLSYTGIKQQKIFLFIKIL
jgi:hypothetical protein